MHTLHGSQLKHQEIFSEFVFRFFQYLFFSVLKSFFFCAFYRHFCLHKRVTHSHPKICDDDDEEGEKLPFGIYVLSRHHKQPPRNNQQCEMIVRDRVTLKIVSRGGDSAF